LLPPIPSIAQQPEPSKPKERPKNIQHEEKAEKVPVKSSSKTSGIDISSIREKHAQEQASGETQRRAEIEKMEAEIRKIDRRRLGEDDDDERAPKKHKGPSVLEQELAKYSKNKSAGKKGKKDESDVLAALSSFRGKLQKSFDLPASSRPDDAPEDGAGGDDDTAELEVDDDREWLNHKLYFPKDESESSKATGDYEVIDPRVRGQQAREEERERRQQKKSQVGRAFQSRSERSGGASGSGGRR